MATTLEKTINTILKEKTKATVIPISPNTHTRLKIIKAVKNHTDLEETVIYLLETFDFFNDENNLILLEEENN